MARARNYGKLYATYMRRYQGYQEKGKQMKESIDINEFIVAYESMYQRYKEMGYKTPTKNIIQNITNEQIYYNFSFKQAQGIKQYFKERGIDYKIYDIRHARDSFSKEQFNEILSATYNELKKLHPEWFTGHKDSYGYQWMKNEFFGGYSKKI